MGNPIYKLKCKDCGENYEIYQGFDCNRKLIKAYYCSKCKEFKYKIFESDNEEIQKSQFCDTCHSEIKVLNIHIPRIDNVKIFETPAIVTPQVHCPHCKSTNVEIFLCGLWD